jgi:hypothetical protein
MVRGATRSLVIDLAFLLEAQQERELPEALIGAFRLNHLDCTKAAHLDTSQELPLLPLPRAAVPASPSPGQRTPATPATTAAGVSGDAEETGSSSATPAKAGPPAAPMLLTPEPAGSGAAGGSGSSAGSSRRSLAGLLTDTAPRPSAASTVSPGVPAAASCPSLTATPPAAEVAGDSSSSQGGSVHHHHRSSFSAGISAIGAKAQRLMGKHRRSRWDGVSGIKGVTQHLQ